VCPENLVNTMYLKNQLEEFRQILVIDVNGLIDVLVAFWGQKVKGKGHSRQ